MAQNKNKPKRSKAERLAKKRRNRHLAELKLLEKARQNKRFRTTTDL